jgi:hypothetical protein
MSVPHDPTCVTLEAVVELPVGQALAAARRALLTLPGVDSVTQPPGGHRLEAVARRSIWETSERLFVEVTPLPEGARVVVTSQSEDDPEGIRGNNAHHAQSVMAQLKTGRVRIAEPRRRNPTLGEWSMAVALVGFVIALPILVGRPQPVPTPLVPYPPFPPPITALPVTALSVPAVGAGEGRPRPVAVADDVALRSLLARGWYSALEARLAGLERDYLVDPQTEHRVWDAYATFQDPDDALGADLERWRKARPGSVEPLLASALWAIERAATSRRRSAAASSAQEAADRRAAEREELRSYLGRARDLRREHLVWFGAYFLAHRADGWSSEQRQVHADLVRLHPGAYLAQRYAIRNAVPRRGGSFDEMERLAAEAQREVDDYPWMRGLRAAPDVERARAARVARDWAEAFGSIQRALAVSRAPEYLVERGDLFREAGDPIRAVADADEALAARPTDPEALRLKAVALYWSGVVSDATTRERAFDAALRHFDRLAELHPRESARRDEWRRYIVAQREHCARDVVACTRCTTGSEAETPICLRVRASAGKL